MGHKIVVELPSTAMAAVETFLALRRLSLSDKCRDELCSRSDFRLEEWKKIRTNCSCRPKSNWILHLPEPLQRQGCANDSVSAMSPMSHAPHRGGGLIEVWKSLRVFGPQEIFT